MELASDLEEDDESKETKATVNNAAASKNDDFFASLEMELESDVKELKGDNLNVENSKETKVTAKNPVKSEEDFGSRTTALCERSRFQGVESVCSEEDSTANCGKEYREVFPDPRLRCRVAKKLLAEPLFLLKDREEEGPPHRSIDVSITL